MFSDNTESTAIIIGYGTVGSNLYKEINALKPDVTDKYKGLKPKYDFHKIGFVCVDTPYLEGLVDTTEVYNAVSENNCEIYVIKSTCIVGTVEDIADKTGKKIIFSPEYYGGTQHCNNFKFDFTVLGGDKNDCAEVIQELQKCYDGRHQFRIVDAKTAELAKLMENAWLATKVSFCGAFWNICNKIDINYEELREIFCLDPRVNPSHTFVYNEKPYWDSHCLNKDVPSVANQFNVKFLKNIIEFNREMKDYATKR